MRISDWSSDVCSSYLSDGSALGHSIKSDPVGRNVGFGKFPILRNIETSRVSVDQAVGDVLDLRARPRSPLLIALDVDEDESLLLAIKTPSGCPFDFTELKPEARRVGKECVRTCRSRRS